MTTHDPGANRPARRLVLRKIAQPGPLPTVTPPPVRAKMNTPLPTEGVTEVVTRSDTITPPKPVETVAAPPPLLPVEEPLPLVRPKLRTYGSLPPMVASIAPLPPPAVDLQRKARSPASWKGIGIGTVLGLAMVATFVVGTRLVKTAPSPSAGAPIQPVATASLLPTADTAKAGLDTTKSTPTEALQPPPVVATALPAPSAPAVGSQAGTAHPGMTSGASTARTLVARGVTAAPAPISTSAPPAASGSQEPAPQDSAQSLVPVIPASAPPPGDPLVKAVQLDIEEEQQSR
jgi:hypothetical protein